MKPTAVPCAAPTAKGPCTRQTRHQSGRCHDHRNLAATSNTAATTAAAQAAATAHYNYDLDSDTSGPLPYREPVEGCPHGTIVGIADHDLIEDGALTAQAYLDVGGPRPVLHGRLTPEGELQLVDAMQIGTTKLETVVEQQQGYGRHPADLELQLGEQVSAAARSMNARMKAGQALAEIQNVNGPRLAKLSDDIDKVAATHPDSPIVGYYSNQHTLLQATLHPDPAPDVLPYPGCKVPMLNPWEGQYTTTVTREVEVAADVDMDSSVVPAKVVDGVRIAPTINGGKARWGGWTSDAAATKVWQVDLGDGWTATYVPERFTNGPKSQFSQRRRLTVVGPVGASCRDGLERLQQCNINTEPATPQTIECVYLEHQMVAAEVLDHPAVQKARVEAAGYVAAAAQVRVEQYQDDTDGMDGPELDRWLRSQLRAAQVDVAGHRARKLREGLAEATGWPSAALLATHPSYQPTPVVGKGTISWQRVAPGPDVDLPAPPRLSHRITTSGDGLVDMVRSGCLASQERRRRMGIPKHGMSPGEDLHSGGASAAFLSTGKHSASAIGKAGGLIWEGEQAQQLMGRTDVYATPGDHYGATNPQSPHFKGGYMRSTSKLAGLSYGEVMVPDSIDFVSYPPTRIRAGTQKRRERILGVFAQQGITELGGRPVHDVVVL